MKAGNNIKVYLDCQPVIKTKTGIGWYTHEIAKELLNLEQDQYEFLGCSFDFLNRNQAEKVIKSLGFKDISVHSAFPFNVYRMIWNNISVSYNHFFPKCDIYHFFNYTVPPKVNGKVIANIYDTVFKIFPETMKKRNLYFLEREIKNSVNNADIILTIGESAKNDIINNLDVAEEKIRIAPPAINQDSYRMFHQQEKETFVMQQIKIIRKKYQLPEKYIMYLGTVEPRKNVKAVFHAYSILPPRIRQEVKLVIAGGRGWQSSEIYQLPVNLKIEEDVIFTGYIDEEEKPYLYHSAEVFVFPSLYEGFGMPVLEALAAGAPVITSKFYSMPEAGGDAAYYIDPEDYEELAYAIEKIISDESKKDEMIIKGYQHSKGFTWEKSAEVIINIYNEIK
jgi:glycosyltransferase involved in cell wall biosynthesis